MYQTLFFSAPAARGPQEKKRVWPRETSQTLLLQKKKLEDELEDRTKEIDLKLGLLTARNRENNRKRTLAQEEEVIEDKVIVSYY